jgi:predicted acetyltransferase
LVEQSEMRDIREVQEDELEEFARITIEAFPGMKIVSREERDRMLERLAKVMKEPIVHFFGAFEADQVVGVMRCYDFTMKLRETRTLVGGLGGVAVDLRHKKERVAADMVRFYLDYYRNKGAALAALYPFRPDFYRRMGFGYGVKINRYSFRPDALPVAGPRARVEYLTADDKEALAACYDRFLERTNGLIELPPHVLDSLFTDPANRIVGFQEDGLLRSYAIFRFQPVSDNNWLANDIELRALIYDDPSALSALLSFLRAQADQVERIIYETQDDTFHYVPFDPRNGSGKLLAGLWHETNTQGAGIMYRVIDTPRLFAVLRDHDFGGVTCRLRLNLTDTFLPENAGSYLIAFEEGRPTPANSGAIDVEVALDISDFSSLAVGAIDFARLYEYGRATISDIAQVTTVNRLFHAEVRPWCMTSF